MKFIITHLILLFLCTDASSQDKIVLNNGSVVTGVVEVTISKVRDVVKINGSEVDLSKIDRIKLSTGEMLKPKRVTYYFKEGGTEEYRETILKELLRGEGNLYSYSGAEFNFVLEIQNTVIALQSIPKGSNLQTLNGFKTDISNLMIGCISEERIERLRLNKSKLIFLVNEYNTCMDENYVPLISPKKKKHIFVYELSAGIHSAQHSLSAPFFRFNAARPIRVGDIDQEGVPTKGWVFNFSFQKNIFNSENLFFYSGIALRKFSFDVTSEDVAPELLSDFEFLEGNYTLGLHYQRKLFKNFSAGLSSGILAWTTTIQDNVYYDGGLFPVIPDYSAKSGGLGVFAQTSVSYELNNKSSFFGTLRGNFRDGKNMFSAGAVRIETGSVQNDDELKDLFTVLLGFRIKVLKRNYLK